MFDFLFAPWPWYVGGPLLGLSVPLMMILASRQPGMAMVFKATCTAVFGKKVSFFNYDWKGDIWRFFFVSGVALGGFYGGMVFYNGEPIALNPSVMDSLRNMGITDFTGMIPGDLFNLSSLSNPGVVLILFLGGLLVGFGSRYADGCTSGHAIMGLAHFQFASLMAVIGFFIGGLIMTHLLLGPILRMVLQ